MTPDREKVLWVHARVMPVCPVSGPGMARKAVVRIMRRNTGCANEWPRWCGESGLLVFLWQECPLVVPRRLLAEIARKILRVLPRPAGLALCSWKSTGQHVTSPQLGGPRSGQSFSTG